MNIYGIGPGLSYSAAITLPFICSLFVALRFYTRKTRAVGLWWDDWLILPALIALIGMCVTVISGVALGGVGYPTKSKTDTKPTIITRQVIWVTYLMGTVLLTCVKISFVLWYRRLFWQGSRRWYKITLHATLAILLVWGISYFFSFMFLCPGHPSAYWGTLNDVKTKCIKTYIVYQSYATSDFILDVVVIVLPMIPLYSLSMSTKKRVAVTGVFLLGAMTIVASILRMITVWEVTAAQYKPGTDIPLILTRATYWGVIECGIAIVSCCLPTCSALLRTKNEGQSGPSYESRIARGSGNSASKLLSPFAHRKPTYTSTIDSIDEEANALSHAQPNKIIVTRTFTAQSAQSSQHDSEKHEVKDTARETR